MCVHTFINKYAMRMLNFGVSLLNHCRLRKLNLFPVLQNDENGDVQVEEGPVLILDFQNKTLYLKMGCSAETKVH